MYPMKRLTFYTGIAVIAIVFNWSCRTEPQNGNSKVLEGGAEISIVNKHLRSEPDRLNPILSLKGFALEVAHLMYLPIMEYGPFDDQLNPILIKEVPEGRKVTQGPFEGGLSYDFEFLDGVEWSDGEPVTAKDYVFGLKLIFNPELQSATARNYQGYYQHIQDVLVNEQNPRQFTVYTKGNYLRDQYQCTFYPMPAHFFDPDNALADISLRKLILASQGETLSEDDLSKLRKVGERFNRPAYSTEPDSLIGLGPYELEEWVKKERIVMKRKEEFWANKLNLSHPYLRANAERIVHYPVPDATAAAALLQSGQIDVMTKVQSVQFDELRKKETLQEEFNFLTPRSNLYNYLALNMNKPELEEKKVRQALAHLMSAQSIIDQFVVGEAQAMVGPVPLFSEGYNNKLAMYEENAEKCKSLLDEAGWQDSDGDGIRDKSINGNLTSLRLTFIAPQSSPLSENIGLLFKSKAKEVGIDIILEKLETRKFFGQRNKGEFHIYPGAAAVDLGLYDPYQYFHTDNLSPKGINFNGFGNSETDEIIEELRSSLDPKRRKELYLKFQEIFHDEVPYIAIFSPSDRMIVSKKFDGIKTSLQSPGLFPATFELSQ